MLKIRFQRFGRTNLPAYRLVVVESTKGPKSGAYIEKLGHYASVNKTKQFNAERIMYWMKQGAKMSDTVHNMMIKEKIIEGRKRNKLPKKTPITNPADEADKEKQII